MGGAYESIHDPIMDHTRLFLPRLTPKFHTNPGFQVPSQHGKWDAVLQGETSIAAGLPHNLTWMHMEDDMDF